MRTTLAFAAVSSLMVLASCARPVADEPTAVAPDPLPSWNEGAAKDTVLEFVDRVNDPAGPDFVTEPDRIAVFGNSDGDFQMLEWTTAGDGARLGVLVHYTDGDREWAYDRESSMGRLDKGLDEAQTRGWTVVDMKKDWTAVFELEERR